jgi:TonB family protein
MAGRSPAASKQEPSGALRVGGDIHAPRKVKDVPPVYPTEALNAKVQGTVLLEATVDAIGTVSAVKVLRSIPLLDQAALDAVKQWEYEPTLLNGQPVPVVLTVTVNFTLRAASMPNDGVVGEDTRPPQALRGLSTNNTGPVESSTICGSPVAAPRILPPTGSGPVVFYFGPCFEGHRSRVEPEVYLHDIHLQASRPSQGIWVPYDAAAEKMILEDFQRLWSNHALDDLSVDIRDYRFSNGVIGKLVTYNIKERN